MSRCDVHTSGLVERSGLWCWSVHGACRSAVRVVLWSWLQPLVMLWWGSQWAVIVVVRSCHAVACRAVMVGCGPCHGAFQLLRNVVRWSPVVAVVEWSWWSVMWVRSVSASGLAEPACRGAVRVGLVQCMSMLAAVHWWSRVRVVSGSQSCRGAGRVMLVVSQSGQAWCWSVSWARCWSSCYRRCCAADPRWSLGGVVSGPSCVVQSVSCRVLRSGQVVVRSVSGAVQLLSSSYAAATGDRGWVSSRAVIVGCGLCMLVVSRSGHGRGVACMVLVQLLS